MTEELTDLESGAHRDLKVGQGAPPASDPNVSETVLNPDGTAHGDIALTAARKRSGIWGPHDIRGRTTAGVQEKHIRTVKWLGRIGWVAKGVVYAILGGLCCKSAVDGQLADTSPQGAFVLLGSGNYGKILLLVEMGGVALYIVWRFWEGITAQGSHPEYSRFTNFFSYRLSPLVSGIVYSAYLVYCCTLVPKAFKDEGDEAKQSDFTRGLSRSTAGRMLLVLLGLAFTAAFLVQLQAAVTRKFHRNIKPRLAKPLWWATIITGHIGVSGRGAFFLLVAILMYRSVSDDNLGSRDQNSFSNALSGLRTSAWGRTILFLVGFGLIVYGLYCMFIAFIAGLFPTPGPTDVELVELRRKRAEREEKKAAKKALKAAKRAEKEAKLSDDRNSSGIKLQEALPADIA